VFILNKFSVYIHIKFSMKNLFIRIFSFLQKINLVSYLVVFFFFSSAVCILFMQRSRMILVPLYHLEVIV
jgi:hypothetical protein